jgi:mono/diheme cytochrome c family protein
MTAPVRVAKHTADKHAAERHAAATWIRRPAARHGSTITRLVAWTLGLLVLIACDGIQPAVDRALQRMHSQPKAQAYGASPVFRDGKVMQPPPAGTVAREDGVDSEASPGLDARGSYLEQVPLPETPALLARGRSRFRIVCAACHGAGGFGGSVVAENWFPPPRPPSLRSGPAAALPAGQLFQIVTSGFGRMPPYAPELTAGDRWAVVAYALTLRGRPPADSAERDDSVRAAGLRVLDSLGPEARR